jgi:hypothetical protein
VRDFDVRAPAGCGGGRALNASAFVTGAFVILPLLVVAGFILAREWAGRRLGEDRAARRRAVVSLGVAAAAWLALTWAVAASGVLRRWDAVPPPLAFLVLAVLAIGIGVPWSPLGAKLAGGLPLWALVGSQVFRFPLELVMHRAYVEGVMPVQMSYSGRNFDILTGIGAGVLGLWLLLGRAPRGAVTAWNLLGLALLANVVTVALVSTPALRWFGDDRLNVWITYPPFVWLPAVLVTAALVGHLLVWRRLAAALHD